MAHRSPSCFRRGAGGKGSAFCHPTIAPNRLRAASRNRPGSPATRTWRAPQRRGAPTASGTTGASTASASPRGHPRALLGVAMRGRRSDPSAGFTDRLPRGVRGRSTAAHSGSPRERACLAHLAREKARCRPPTAWLAAFGARVGAGKEACRRRIRFFRSSPTRGGDRGRERSAGPAGLMARASTRIVLASVQGVRQRRRLRPHRSRDAGQSPSTGCAVSHAS